MQHIENVVVRLNSGKLLKGYVRDFSVHSNVVVLEEFESRQELRIPIIEVKAIFFVRTFEGDKSYREKKSYGLRQNLGRKVYIKFRDGEAMMGFIEGKIPWEKGFFISNPDNKVKGFYLIPTDSGSNNIKVFVVGSSIKDMTIMP
ncbi:MAG: hypothetical protein OEZ31_02100 [Nitrospirota bacterium]|nr:hypothetical protein [Nitrospirota bacterium]MDH5767738.1 hypothetical protein [Nitrospirota bacterium]